MLRAFIDARGKIDAEARKLLFELDITVGTASGVRDWGW